MTVAVAVAVIRVNAWTVRGWDKKVAVVDWRSLCKGGSYSGGSNVTYSPYITPPPPPPLTTSIVLLLMHTVFNAITTGGGQFQVEIT